MPTADEDRKVEQALQDLVGYVFRRAVPVKRALLYVEHDHGNDVRTRIAELLIAVDRDRRPRTSRELVWGAVARFVGNVERAETAPAPSRKRRPLTV